MNERPLPEPRPSDAPDTAEAKRLLEEEEREAEHDAEEQRRQTEGLLRFIDEDLEGNNLEMPVFSDPLEALQYIAGVVETRRTAQDIRHRRNLIGQVQVFAVGWIVAVLVILVLVGLGALHHLSDGVLMVLAGTTTVNVLGLAAIILSGLFERDPPDHLARALLEAEKNKDGR